MPTRSIRQTIFFFSLLFVGICSMFLFFAKPVYTATLDFSPQTASLDVGDTQNFILRLNTSGVAVNATDVSFTYSVANLEITSVVKQPLFSYWPDEPVYSNTLGTFSFSGGLPSPGYTGTAGDIIQVTVKAKAIGTAQLCESSLIINQNNGSGTNVASTLQCATFIISEPIVAVPNAPTVTSSTHPNPEVAYTNTDPSFEWTEDAGVTGFSYSFNQDPTTIPDDISEGTETSTQYIDIASGIWYFHIKAENAGGWSTTTHLKIQIDTGAPPVPDAPSVESTTHPNQNIWYPDASGQVAWTQGGTATGYSYVLDQISNTIPDDNSEGTDVELSFTTLADGTWYFHIKAQNENGWGAVTHFVIHIDTTNPTLEAIFQQTSPTTDTTPSVEIVATDTGSGIATLIVQIDGGSAIDLLSYNLGEYVFSELAAGIHEFVFRATDFAGNVTVQTISFTIREATIVERINDTINNIIPDPIKRAVESVTRPIQRTVESITEPLRNLVQDLQKDRELVDTTKKVAEPIAQAAAAIGVATALATLPVGLVNALFAFFRFGYLLLSPLFIGRRGKSWGVVIDSITRKPVGRAVVRVFETEFNKLKESQITDQLGRFGFLVEEGNYVLTAEKAGYTFPSKLSELHSFETPAYTGGEIHVGDRKNPHINVTIPLDPSADVVTPQRLFWKKIRDIVYVFLEIINWPLLIIGLGVSLWAAVIVPDTLNSLLLTLYVFLMVLKVVRMKLTVKSFGTVKEKGTGHPLGIATVRIFDAKKKVMITTRITNEDGKFSALIQPGEYYLIVTKSGYEPKQTEAMKLSKTETLALDVELAKQHTTTFSGPETPPPSVAQPKSPPSQM